jgi:signal transduction histidine kinase
MIVSAIPRLYFHYFSIEVPARSEYFFNGIFIATSLSLIIFFLVMNKIVVKRITTISQALITVSRGQFDVFIPVRGQDEISDLTKNFNQMVNEIQLKDQMSSEFIRNFSHELKTPISTLKGYADLILSDQTTIEEIKAYATIISDESTRLSNLSKNMLMISMIDSGSIIKRDKPYNVSEQIRHMINVMQVDWESKNLSFDLNLSDVKLDYDSTLTYHLFNNLISNAIRYSKIDSIIEIGVEVISNEMHFQIKDYGLGISEYDQAHIFEAFYTGNRVRNEKNTGVGLTLVKKIVDKLNGRITLDSI